MTSIRKRTNFAFVFRVVGLMCLIETLFLLLSFFVSWFYHDGGMRWLGLTIVAACVVGLVCFLLGSGYKRHPKSPGKREGMLAVTATWVVLSLVGMLPFLIGGYTRNISHAFFETVSGITTTGATIFTEVEWLPRSILFWRSLLQWQGGIGIVVFSIALVPMIGTGAGVLYNAETTGITHDRFMPRITQVAKRLFFLYVSITTILVVLLKLGDMSLFDSVCHAMTCISTGGFSTKNASIGYYHSSYIEYILSLFMFIGSLNLTIVYFAVMGSPRQLLRDEQFRWFTMIVGVLIAILSVWLMTQHIYQSWSDSVREATFMLLSMISSTGYVTTDINLWGSFFVCISMLVMMVCGCAGSTAGGFKISRLIVLAKNLRNEFRHRSLNHVVTSVKIDGVSLKPAIVSQVMAFLFLYIILIGVGTTMLTISGNDFVAASTSAVSAISNVGPSFGKYSVSYEMASDWDLNILSFLMLAGRLEVFTVISILTRSFWKS